MDDQSRRGHHQDLRYREQREGDLRRLQRALTRSSQRDPQPVQRVLESRRALRRDRPFARDGVQRCHEGHRRQPGRVCVGVGFSGNLGSGRLPEGRPRGQDRGRRSARVPDHASQRVWRAQHSRHWRQAHPTDSQRHQHRLGGRRERRFDQPARHHVQQPGWQARARRAGYGA